MISKTWYHNYVIRYLRRIWGWAPERRKVLENAKVKTQTKKCSCKARRCKHTKYRCDVCRQVQIRKGVAVDHREPVVYPSQGFKDWNTYIARLFCKQGNLQVLCVTCHKTKTQKEKEIRRKFNESRAR